MNAMKNMLQKEQKRDLLYSWGLPIIGIPSGIALLIIGWASMNMVSLSTTTIGVFPFSLFLFISGIVGFSASVVMLVEVKKGIISPMFINK